LRAEKFGSPTEPVETKTWSSPSARAATTSEIVEREPGAVIARTELVEMPEPCLFDGDRGRVGHPAPGRGVPGEDGARDRIRHRGGDG